MRSQFRHYFRDVADQIYNERNKIKAFIRKSNRQKKRTVKKAPKRRGKKTLRKKN